MDTNRMVDVKPKIDDAVDKTKASKLTEITEPSQCRTIRLSDNLQPSKALLFPLNLMTEIKGSA